MIRPSLLVGLALVAGTCVRAQEAHHAAEPAAPAPADSVVRAAVIPNLERYTVFDSATYDVDGDGAAERVDLSAMVGRDERGWLWDDNNPWLVVVRDGATAYPLLRENLAGSAAFWIVAADSAAPAAILVQTSALSLSGGGTRLEKFVFDRAKGGYVRAGGVEAWGRVEYRGPPESHLLPPTEFRGTIRGYEGYDEDSVSSGSSGTTRSSP